jgi:hypothetical protein
MAPPATPRNRKADAMSTFARLHRSIILYCIYDILLDCHLSDVPPPIPPKNSFLCVIIPQRAHTRQVLIIVRVFVHRAFPKELTADSRRLRPRIVGIVGSNMVWYCHTSPPDRPCSWHNQRCPLWSLSRGSRSIAPAFLDGSNNADCPVVAPPTLQ